MSNAELNLDAISFIPVLGSQERILKEEHTPGLFYCATDSGRMFIDTLTDNKVPLGSGVSILYGADTAVIDNYDDTYNYHLDALDGKVSPRENDLIINSDGYFYKIKKLNLANNIAICSILAVSGGSGGGGGTTGGSGENTLTAIVGVNELVSYIYGKEKKISYKVETTVNSTLTLTLKITPEVDRIPITIQRTSLNSGDIVEFDLGSVLKVGSNNVQLILTNDTTSRESKTKEFRVNCTKVGLQKDTQFYNYDLKYGTFSFGCYASGATDVAKRIKLYIDNILYDTKENVSSSSLTSFSISNLSHGYHTLRAVLNIKDGSNWSEEVADELIYEIAYRIPGEQSPIVWFGQYENKVLNYLPVSIPFMVYDPMITSTEKMAVYYYDKDGNPMSPSTQEIEFSTMGFASWDIPKYQLGKNKFFLSYLNITREVNIEILENLGIDLELTNKDNLVLSFESEGRSNSEPLDSRKQWKSGEHSAVLTGFNWYNNGWIKSDELNGISCLRVSNGAQVTIPLADYFQHSEDVFGVTGAFTFEFQFKLRNIKDFDYLVVNQTNVSIDPETGEEVVTVEKMVNTDSTKSCIRFFRNGTGISIGTQEAFFLSPKSEVVNVKYSENELINLSFTLDPENLLIYIYLNGIVSGVIPYTGVSKALGTIVIGSDLCDIDIYKVRIYKRCLSTDDIVKNYLYNLKDVKLYKANQLINREKDKNLIDFELVKQYNLENPDNPLIPYAIIETTEDITQDGELPYKKIEDGDAWLVNIDFVNPLADYQLQTGQITEEQYIHACPSYRAIGVDLNVQGTSSQGYPRRNYKAKFKQPANKGQWYYTELTNEDGSPKTLKKWFLDSNFGSNKFTWKVDYMESSSTHNTGLANFIPNLYSGHPLTASAYSSVFKEGELDGLRTTIKGFPMLVFHKNSKGEISFIGRYNYNLDKGDEANLGFEIEKSHPYVAGKTFKDVTECWEFGNNQGTRCSFRTENGLTVAEDFKKINTETGKLTILKDLEVCYHVDGDLAEDAYKADSGYTVEQANEVVLPLYKNIQKLYEWIDSTNRDKVDENNLRLLEDDEIKEYGGRTFTHDSKEYRLAKFKAEFNNHFNFEYSLIYFIMTELLIMYDSRGKNMLLASWGPQSLNGEYIWYPIFYDMDTQMGLNNSGVPSFNYNTKCSEDKIYSTSDSILWLNFEDCFMPNIKMKYQDLRDRLILSANSIENSFTKNSLKGLYPQVAYNADYYTKYLAPTIGGGYINTNGKTLSDEGKRYYCLQGNRQMERALFLDRRFNFKDSEWSAGDYNTVSNIQFRFNHENKGSGTLKSTSDLHPDEKFTNPKYDLLNAKIELNLNTVFDQYKSFKRDESAITPIFGSANTSTLLQLPPEEQEVVETLPGYAQLVYIGGSEYIKDFGDLSRWYLDEAIFKETPRLERILLGNDTEGYYNSSSASNFTFDAGVDTVTKEEKKPLLEEVVLTGIRWLDGKTLDFKGAEKLKIFRALNTGIASVDFKQGVQLHTLHLPYSCSSLELINAFSLTNIIENLSSPHTQGLYLEKLFNRPSVTESTNLNDISNINSLTIHDDNLGIKSYQILKALVDLKKEIQDNGNTILKENLGILKFDLREIDWSPYTLVENNTEYKDTITYYYYTDHFTFEEYDYNKYNWKTSLLNKRIYTYDTSKSNNYIDNINLLDNIIDGINEGYFTDLKGSGYPILTGNIYIESNSEINEVILDSYKDYFPNLIIATNNTDKAYSLKCIEVLADGTEKIWYSEKVKTDNSATWFKNPYNEVSPTKKNYDFTKGGWTSVNNNKNFIVQKNNWNNLSFNSDQYDYVYYTYYEPREYTVVFKNYNGEYLIENDSTQSMKIVKYGQFITPIENVYPYRPDEGLTREYHYLFSGYGLTQNASEKIDLNIFELNDDLFDNNDYEITLYTVFEESNIKSEKSIAYFKQFFNFTDGSTSINGNNGDIIRLSGRKATLKDSIRGKLIIPDVDNEGNPVIFFDVSGASTSSASTKTEMSSLITHLFFPINSQLKMINAGAFNGNKNLQFIDSFPDSLKILGAYSFCSCSNLSTENSFLNNNNLEIIQSYAFNQSLKLYEENDGKYYLALSPSIYSIQTAAFSHIGGGSSYINFEILIGDKQNASKLNFNNITANDKIIFSTNYQGIKVNFYTNLYTESQKNTLLNTYFKASTSSPGYDLEIIAV